MKRLTIAMATVGLVVGGLLPLAAASASATTEYTSCGAWVTTSRTYANGVITTKQKQSCYSYEWNIYGSNQIIDRTWTNYRTSISHVS